jgi:membrane-bound serine protease (ClpP class)
MRKWFFLGLLVVGLSLLVAGGVSADTSNIDVLRVDGTVNPVLAGYIERGIEHAEKHGATCIIELDTPGGLDSSMRDIVQSILEADVPVVVYVPPGGRAASAGAFITMAAHVAAMSPGTEIGAAHPVDVSGGDIGETMESKVVNDAVAYIRSIAELRGRNTDWAEAAVRESKSSPASEALELGVIDIVANNFDQLLSQLDGWQVTLLSGEVVTINTKDAEIDYIDMGFLERFLFIISDSNIALILLSIGMLGVFFELASPGTIFPGVIGVLCLFLAFFALGMLPINYAGIILIVVAFGLFIAEVFVTSYGLLVLAGIASYILGATMLIGNPFFEINLGLIAGMAVAIAAIFVFVVASVVRTHRKRQPTGREAMVGTVAVARTTLDPAGTVLAHGELWQATMEKGSVEPGEEVMITKIDGLKLRVSKKNKEGGE